MPIGKQIAHLRWTWPLLAEEFVRAVDRPGKAKSGKSGVGTLVGHRQEACLPHCSRAHQVTHALSGPHGGDQEARQNAGSVESHAPKNSPQRHDLDHDTGHSKCKRTSFQLDSCTVNGFKLQIRNKDF